MIKSQFTLYLENRPGALARAAGAIAKAKVNIEGISALASPDVGLVQIIVDNPKLTVRALKKGKISFTEQKVCVLPVKNRPGELARLASKLAGKGVNINYVYGTTCAGGCGECDLVVSAPDLRKVEKTWRS
jgi:hypothetical protein